MFRRARVLIRITTQEHKLSSKCYIFCLFIWFSLPTFLHNVSAFVHMFLFQKLTTNKSMNEKRKVKEILVQHNKSFSKELIFFTFSICSIADFLDISHHDFMISFYPKHAHTYVHIFSQIICNRFFRLRGHREEARSAVVIALNMPFVHKTPSYWLLPSPKSWNTLEILIQNIGQKDRRQKIKK